MYEISRPHVMGIINLSPDSFSTTGRAHSTEAALQRALQCVAEGAMAVDIGAEATNPKQDLPVIPLQQELDRLIPVVETIGREIEINVSVDTSKPEVMRAAVAVGAQMINDQRALSNEGALQTVKELQVPVCLMHMRFPHGQPMPPTYNYARGVVNEVFDFLAVRVAQCCAAGIARDHLMIDPGIGYGSFGKTTDQNLQLLQHLTTFKTLKLPIMIGVSRKTFIGEILDKPEQQRMAGSLAATTYAWLQGATVIRTHDVAAAVDAMKIVQRIQQLEEFV